ncbi:MAG TPA: alpha/beta hydrolase [Bauldia sp.]|nr:alpha/beta hydrolase [Bauldia sp.]
MALREHIVPTPFANLSILESEGNGLPVLFIHGNSNDRHVFRHQMRSDLAERYRLIAVDLPGHGHSSDAFDPVRTYSMPGYAECLGALIDVLGLERTAAVGWSLGGHVALEMIPRTEALIGVMIVGAPPVGAQLEAIKEGFQETPALYLAGKEDFSEDDFKSFTALTLGPFADAESEKSMRRTHGLARRLSFEALLAGKAADERHIVQTSTTPVAVLNGEKDGIVNIDYLDSVKFRNLWSEHCYILRGIGHAPFLEAPKEFNRILGDFLAYLEGHGSAGSERIIARGAA